MLERNGLKRVLEVVGVFENAMKTQSVKKSPIYFGDGE